MSATVPLDRHVPGADAPTARRERSAFLDLLRAAALVRVVLWHTLGTVALSYIAAIPLMFFVGGSLAGPSSSRYSLATLYARRVRRLLVPLWVYALVAWAVFLLLGAAGAGLQLGLGEHSFVWWILPLWDPVGPEWAIAWWAPLWYLRAYLWLLLLTPLLWRAVNRLPWPSLAVPVGAVLGGGLLVERGIDVVWQFRDLALFGSFWIAGMLYASGRLRARRPILLVAAGFAALVGVAWMQHRPVPLGIVNASYVGQLCFGAAWIAVALALEAPITRLAKHARVSAWSALLNRRAVTVYLWHGAAAYGAFLLVDQLGLEGGWASAVLVVGVVCLTALCTEAVGWVEDVGARRSPTRSAVDDGRVARVVRALAVGGALLLVAVVVSTPTNRDDGGEGLPQFVQGSGRGIELLSAASVQDERPPEEDPISSEPVQTSELHSELVAWARDWGISGAIVAVRAGDGAGWTDAVGAGEGGGVLDAREVVPLQSITKSFTAALILTLADDGRLDLDEPVSTWAPELPHATEVTARQLLHHASGLGASGLEPATALRQASTQPLAFAPGTDHLYSDVGYFELGFLGERVGGAPFRQLLHERLLDPLGLGSTALDDELSPGPTDRGPGDYAYFGDRWSAGGMRSTVDDTARWAVAFWGGQLGEQVAATAQQLDEPSYLGAGTNGFCPCWRDGGGRVLARTYGHLSPHGRTAWSPSDGLGVAVYTVPTLDDRTYRAWEDLDVRLRRITRGRELPG